MGYIKKEKKGETVHLGEEKGLVYWLKKDSLGKRGML